MRNHLCDATGAELCVVCGEDFGLCNDPMDKWAITIMWDHYDGDHAQCHPAGCAVASTRFYN